MAIITNIPAHTVVDKSIMWLEGSEDNIPEPAVLMEAYEGVLSIQQQDNSILINWEDIKDFIKEIKRLEKQLHAND